MKSSADSKRSNLRLFFAVDLEEEVRAKVARESALLRQAFETDPRLKGRKWAWVADQNFHLTVKFLGATDEEMIPFILEAVKSALAAVPSFEMEIAGAGAFPRVLWLDVKDPSLSLSKIAQQLDQVLEPLGMPRESRAFVPHLTLARLKEGKPIQAMRDLRNEWRASSFGKSRVNEIILYKSDTRPTGAVYEPVGRVSLAEPLGGPS